MTESPAKVSVHIEEVPKDLEEQVEDLHAQVIAYLFYSITAGASFQEITFRPVLQVRTVKHTILL